MLMPTKQYKQFYAYLETVSQESGYTCDNEMTYTVKWLQEHVPDYRETLEKIVDLGGHCDCEVLMNVRPRKYTKQFDVPIDGPNLIGQDEWDSWIDDLILCSGPEETTDGKDIQRFQEIAYAVAASVVMDTYPDVYSDLKMVDAVAKANWNEFAQEFTTNEPQLFSLAFIAAFTLGYVESATLFRAEPQEYESLLKLTDDERVPVFKKYAAAWSRRVDKFGAQMQMVGPVMMKSRQTRKSKKPFRVKRRKP